jgi:heme exporter protein A
LTLSAEGVSVDRGARSIIQNLSFRVSPGELMLLTGPNGAGKTTLIRAMAGLIGVTAGKFTLSTAPADTSLAEHCHYVGHTNGVKATLTASENLTFWADFLGGRREDVDHALDVMTLAPLATIPAAYLSAGQKRRLGLARLLVAKRPVWLLDEPTVSLDTASVRLLAGAIESHLASGGIAVAATHIPLGVTGARELRLGVARPTGDAAA